MGKRRGGLYHFHHGSEELPDSGQISVMARTESQRGGGPLWRIFTVDDGQGA